MNMKFLFNGLNLTAEQLEEVADRTAKRVENEINWVKNPIVEDKKRECFFVDEKQYPKFPRRGYATIEQAETALFIWKMNPELNDNALELLSKAILAAITA